MRRFAVPAGVLALCTLVFLLYVSQGGTSLPPRVATRFDFAGQPSGWMSREGYRRFLTVFGLGLPAITVGIAWLSRLFPAGAINLPDREYWQAPERRAAVLDFVFAHCLWLASLEVGLMAGLHHLTVLANASVPVRMPPDKLIPVMAAFLAGVAIWAVTFARHFRRRGVQKT